MLLHESLSKHGGKLVGGKGHAVTGNQTGFTSKIPLSKNDSSYFTHHFIYYFLINVYFYTVLA